MECRLLREGTREELSQEIQRRGLMRSEHSASSSKAALRQFLKMALELEAKEQQLALAEKRPAAASPATPSKRAAAADDAGAEELSEADDAGAEEVSEAVSPSCATSARMACSAYSNRILLCASFNFPQASTAARRPEHIVDSAGGPCATSACLMLDAAGCTSTTRLTWIQSHHYT